MGLSPTFHAAVLASRAGAHRVDRRRRDRGFHAIRHCRIRLWFRSGGLVSGFLFEPGQQPREIPSAEAVAWLQRQDAAGPFLWLHFNLSHSACERWMKTHLGLPDDFFEALRQGSHSTRIERQEDALLAVVNDVIYNFGVTSDGYFHLWANADHRAAGDRLTRPAALGGQAARRRAPGARTSAPRWTSSSTCCAIRPMCWYRSCVRTGVSADQIEDRLLAQRLQGNRADPRRHAARAEWGCSACWRPNPARCSAC